ncbi:MAG TPA: hypothetical protein VNN18_11845 [Candidatus Xenobia bacterium]|nr:hypothetical protein [Candidatus Xenobia bacterium]
MQLAQGDPNADEDEFVGSVGAPNVPFRVAVSGLTSNGSPYHRIFPPIFGPPPLIYPGGAVNAASFAPGAPVAPGSIVAVFGAGLSLDTAQAAATPLPTMLAGARMLFDQSVAVPKFFASPSQVNIQIPWQLSGHSEAILTDNVQGLPSDPITVNLAPFAPGIYTTNSQGTGQGNILIAGTASIAAPVGAFSGSRPVMRGSEYISIYCTGLGAVTNQPASGSAASASPLSQTTTTPTVSIGGVAATVTFSGLAPGLVGLYQVNALVPATAPIGDAVPVVLSIGTATSNTVTIAVQ